MIQKPIEVDQKICGTVYLPQASGRYPTVLLLHGFSGSRMENGFFFVKLGRALAAQGIAAVTFDFRHSGESEGSFDQMLITGELQDTMRMTQWMRTQSFCDRTCMGLLGFSLGGLLTATAMARTDVYKAAVMLAPTTVDNILRITRREEGTRPAVASAYLHADFARDALTLNPVSDVIKNPRPTLLVQGTDDKAVPPRISQAFVDAMNRVGMALDHVLIDGADHSFSKPDHRQRVIELVVDWISKTLKA
ncbi:MAG: alpha/beta fold hydrolase [Phycisphaeraceae bacterium]|nr:alpha/beta fold hydrolase [Phycisphaeraceae bacterium]